jgi:glycosyltransferase involved in cell wall biosynthesis
MRLPAPEPSLEVSVVLPARDEEALIARCLEALARQKNVVHEKYEVLLVLDRCSDGTEERARELVKAHPDLRLRFLDGPGIGVGHARRVGMEAACERLMEVGNSGGLIASTDADSVAASDWISSQISLAEGGARAIGGRIELEDGGRVLSRNALDWYEKQSRSRYRRVLASGLPGDAPEHWQFSGASLSLTAEAYREIGGLPPQADLEDEYLERTLKEKGVEIFRSSSVKVTTSPRVEGRASRGLARSLSDASLRGAGSRESGEAS